MQDHIGLGMNYIKNSPKVRLTKFNQITLKTCFY